MPTYSYACRSCEYEFEMVESIHLDAQTHCPNCEQEELRRVITSAPLFHVSNYNTVGSLADKNWKKMGHYEKEDKTNNDSLRDLQAKKEKQQHLSKLNKMSNEQKKKWIIEGD